ncbi:MAG: isoprenylcysteine carboxyl methyltransferase [Hyphomicrobiales bacterium]|nr:MAG: isoprenylcysteine carboxyl methyltransferase [Hyphomicrobiales bacterium]
MRLNLTRAIESLPEHYRQIVLLRDVEELTINEIAQSLSREAVKGRRHRARIDPGISAGIAPCCPAFAWRRTMPMAILGSALFFVVAPCVVAGLIPWWITSWEFLPPFLDLQATRAVGILLIVAGLPGLVDSFARFALQGLGTPAPIAPTQNLVVTGLYRHVRNPMYVAVVAVILGQAILFGDWRLVIYGAFMWLAFHAFVLTYEEPVLAQRFGSQYEDFRANVPRWIPRLSPWRAR